MRFSNFTLALLLTGLILPQSGWTQCDLLESQQLLASDGTAGASYGAFLDMSDERAIISAVHDDAKSGAAYILIHDGLEWIEQQKLVASDKAAGSEFAYSVAIDGDVAVATSIRAEQAYVFRFDGNLWVEEQILASGVAGDGFGNSVSIEDGVLVVGAQFDDEHRGAAYVYIDNGVEWVLCQKLTASDGQPGDAFACSVSLDADTLVVGAFALEDFRGAAYIFDGCSCDWEERAKLYASDGLPGDRFGAVCDVCDDRVIIGAPSATTPFGDEAGAAYIFHAGDGLWSDEHKLVAEHAGDGFYAGHGVSITDEDLAVVGAPTGGASGPGEAYLYQYDGADWVLERRLLSSAGAIHDRLGNSVGISGGRVLAGANGDDDLGGESGSVFAYEYHELVLQASSDRVKAGDTIRLSVCDGVPGTTALLAVTQFDATPMFLVVARGAFDSQRSWSIEGPAPPGILGVFTFQAFGFYEHAQLGASNTVQVTWE